MTNTRWTGPGGTGSGGCFGPGHMLRSWIGSSHSATQAAGKDSRVAAEWATELEIVSLAKWSRTGRTMPVPASDRGGGTSLFSIATVACRCVIVGVDDAGSTRTEPSLAL